MRNWTRGNPRTREQLAALLLEKRRVTPSGCWEWIGSRDTSGYGMIGAFGITRRRRILRVHRLAAYLWKGFDIESSVMMCHVCDNPPCFNPDHLFEGSNLDNMGDAARKNRVHFQFRRGENGQKFCARGHLITPDNISCPKRNDGRKIRQCRLCYNEYMRTFRRRQAQRTQQHPVASGN